MRVVVTGASGQLGSHLLERLIQGPHEVVGWSGRRDEHRAGVALLPVELTDRHAVCVALEDANPHIVIHAAAVSSAEAAWRDPQRSEAVNVLATQFLADWASQHDRRLVYISTDLVFDGVRGWYREEDHASPILVYGRTKHVAERFVLAAARGLVARLSLLYGPSRSGRAGFFDRSTAALRAGEPQAFFTDEFRTPLDYTTAARIIVRLAESNWSGLIHVGGPERLSRFALMHRAAQVLGLDPRLVKRNRHADLALTESRPADVSLDCARLHRLFPDLLCPQLEQALSASP